MQSPTPSMKACGVDVPPSLPEEVSIRRYSKGARPPLADGAIRSCRHERIPYPLKPAQRVASQWQSGSGMTPNCASNHGGRHYMWAAALMQQSAATSATPTSSAMGNMRPGLLGSPPAVVKVIPAVMKPRAQPSRGGVNRVKPQKAPRNVGRRRLLTPSGRR